MYQEENDYWRIRDFLRQTFILNELRQLNWHVIENSNACDLVEKVTYLWETPERQIAAVLNPEGRGNAFLQVHSVFHTKELEEKMLTIAEKHLVTSTQMVANCCTSGLMNAMIFEKKYLSFEVTPKRKFETINVADCYQFPFLMCRL